MGDIPEARARFVVVSALVRAERPSDWVIGGYADTHGDHSLLD